MLDARDWGHTAIPGVFTLAGNGVQILGASNVAEALRSTLPIKVVMVKARANNAATIYLGSSTVTANENASTGGLQLSPGDMLTFAVDDIADVFVVGTIGDGVSFAYWT